MKKKLILKHYKFKNANLKRLIEAKNGEIESLKVDNKKKDLLLMNHENKIEKLKKKIRFNKSKK